jgi:polysaccharide biosynthesis/export protein
VRILALLSALLVAGCAQDFRYNYSYTVETGAYRLATGDQVRLIVYDQPGLSNIYGVDASGNISVPLIGAVKAENKTTRQLEAAISSRLQEQNLVTEPKVAVEVGVYRPFSILGEVRAPGRFPYSPGMTVEAAVALAGGYTIHADQGLVRVTHRYGNEMSTEYVPPIATVKPGDVVYISERWY